MVDEAKDKEQTSLLRTALHTEMGKVDSPELAVAAAIQAVVEFAAVHKMTDPGKLLLVMAHLVISNIGVLNGE